MRTEKHRELMTKLLKQNMKSAWTGRKGKEKGRPLTEKEALEKITEVYRKTLV